MTAAAKVLIVDDRDIVRETLRDILVDFGCIFTEVDNGVTALSLLHEREFDVIFLDLRLPDVPGMEVLRTLRRSDVVQGKVIILTGLPDPVTKAEADNLGVFRYLTKPLEWATIREAFAAALSDSPFPSKTSKLERRSKPRIASPAQRRAHSTKACQVSRDRRPHLLILDDEPSWLDTLEQVLGTEFDLTLTNSAKEACSRARKEPFSLVVLDAQLTGGISGLNVLSQMRRVAPDLRAIILTGYPDRKSENESGGALAYVSKGHLATLSQTVKGILAENSQPIRVFLCYDRRDRTRVYSLFQRLTNWGYLPWMDVKGIVPGMKWEPQIKRAINQATYFVFCLSSTTRYNHEPLQNELKQALERQHSTPESSIFFITVRLDGSEIAEPFRRFYYVDLFRKDGFAHLLQALSSEGRADM